MKALSRSVPWRAIARSMAWAYGISFVCGFVLAAIGITPQTDPALYPLVTLLSGGIGVAVFLRLIGITAPADIVMFGVGLWLIDLSTVLLGAQTLAGWFDSAVFVGTTVILGRLMLGSSCAPLSEPQRRAM
ncbi:MAG: hypothetical protein QM706_12330 [Nitrospira sp.]